MINDHLNAAHARWRDGILAHNIVDVRHVPGKLNVVADGLSRQWEGQPRDANQRHLADNNGNFRDNGKSNGKIRTQGTEEGKTSSIAVYGRRREVMEAQRRDNGKSTK